MDVKSHLKKYKKGYVCGAIGVAGITYLIMKPLGICIAGPAKDLHSRTMDHGVSFFAGRDAIGNTIINNVQYNGYSHKLVQNAGTGEIFQTVTAAAEAAGVELSRMSRHVNGHIPHINGDTYRIIGIGTGN